MIWPIHVFKVQIPLGKGQPEKLAGPREHGTGKNTDSELPIDPTAFVVEDVWSPWNVDTGNCKAECSGELPSPETEKQPVAIPQPFRDVCGLDETEDDDHSGRYEGVGSKAVG